MSFACIRKANAIETRSFVLKVVDKVDFQIKMQRYEFLLKFDPMPQCCAKWLKIADFAVTTAKLPKKTLSLKKKEAKNSRKVT